MTVAGGHGKVDKDTEGSVAVDAGAVLEDHVLPEFRSDTMHDSFMDARGLPSIPLIGRGSL